jgi:hypothetical protein
MDTLLDINFNKLRYRYINMGEVVGYYLPPWTRVTDPNLDLCTTLFLFPFPIGSITPFGYCSYVDK